MVIYYQNEKSAAAGILTALSNRVGDAAILVAIGLIYTWGGFNFIFYSGVAGSELGLSISMFVALAAITKRAQIPFSAWLPAAIAAPTPVRALVHSSTLVTAGVYLIIRFGGALLESGVSSYLLLIGSLTILIAGLGANFEYDLKKIIALSTLSQLGIIVRIVGAGLPELRFFHLLAHAIFKALLFICAGRVIHGVGEFQDIRAIGAVPHTLPAVAGYITICNLALCGAPFLAGFYSKDLILETLFISNLSPVIFGIYCVATGLTVRYTFRLIFYTGLGGWNLKTLGRLGEGSGIITRSIVALGTLAVCGGRTISWLILPAPNIICITTFIKSLTLLLVISGALLGLIINF